MRKGKPSSGPRGKGRRSGNKNPSEETNSKRLSGKGSSRASQDQPPSGKNQPSNDRSRNHGARGKSRPSALVRKKPSSLSPEKKLDTSTRDTAEPQKTRLNKYISNSGICSRREADELIQQGLISVNGKVVTELGFKVNPGDVIRHEGKLLKAEKHIYILLNKPKGYLTTTNDPQERNTVMHLIGNEVKERIYPVGRLDRNTTGLLLLTNDGELAQTLMHPSFNVKKIYKVELDKPITKTDFEKIVAGVRLEEGLAVVDDIAVVSDDKKTVGIELHIGWNRVVRRIFEALGYEVVRLDRSVYAGLDKKDLPRGHWRFLKKEELVKLKHFNKGVSGRHPG